MRRLKSKGAILIEFAFGLPILVLMLYFCLDVPKAYQFVNKLRTYSEIAADLITNVYSYEGDACISIEELKYVSRALEIYFLGNPAQREYGFNISMYITCVTGTGSGRFKTNWVVGVDNDISARQIKAYRLLSSSGSISTEGFSGTRSKALSANLKGTELENFEVGKGDTKLIVEAFVWRNPENRGFNRQFYMMSLPVTLIANKFVVVTPPSGLISDQYPPMTEDELDSFQEILDKHRDEDNANSILIQQQRSSEEVAFESTLSQYLATYRIQLESNYQNYNYTKAQRDKLINSAVVTEEVSRRNAFKNQLDQKYKAQQKALDTRHNSEIKNFANRLPGEC